MKIETLLTQKTHDSGMTIVKTVGRKIMELKEVEERAVAEPAPFLLVKSHPIETVRGTNFPDTHLLRGLHRIRPTEKTHRFRRHLSVV